jgi:hypothetical protein
MPSCERHAVNWSPSVALFASLPGRELLVLTEVIGSAPDTGEAAGCVPGRTHVAVVLFVHSASSAREYTVAATGYVPADNTRPENTAGFALSGPDVVPAADIFANTPADHATCALTE